MARERASKRRMLRTEARRARGNEPVVSIIVAFVFGDLEGLTVDCGRFERRLEARRWRESWDC